VPDLRRDVLQAPARSIGRLWTLALRL